MSSYTENRKNHLANYKVNSLLIKENGLYVHKSKDYYLPHILPIEKREANVLEPIRSDFWKYFNDKSKSDIKLHQYFHHLNSSQALCFNLFYPLFYRDRNLLPFVLNRILEIPKIENINYVSEFEKVLSDKEGTNFDFYIHFENSNRVLFELKYTETEFGKAKNDERHRLKLTEIYKPKLQGILKEEYINEKSVFENYQIVRNLSYIDNKTTVVFIFPKANEKLKETRNIIESILLPENLKYVRIIETERLIDSILNSEHLLELKSVYTDFNKKYIVE